MQVFLILFMCASCTIDFDIVDHSQASSTLNFANPDDFDFDENYVEIKNNQISLKPLDLEHSGDDFLNGSHVGSPYPLCIFRGRGLLSWSSQLYFSFLY